MSFLRRRGAPFVALLAAVGALGVGCGGSSGSKAAPVIKVATTNFAMTELVHGVGGTRVAVIDLAQGAADDRTLVLSPAQRSATDAAGLVVEVGGGWQPNIEAVAGTGSRVLALGLQGPATGSQVWLDPVAMQSAAKALAATLTALDPAGAGTYRNGLQDFNENLSSVSEDYQSSLSDCAYNTVFTPDAAFATVIARYGLKLYRVPAGGDSAGQDVAAAAASTQSFHGLFKEPPLASPPLVALAARGKASLGQLDTMDGPPIKPEPASSTYVDRLEANLTALIGGLYCQDSNGP